MKLDQNHLKFHFLVCTNSRKEGESCFNRGAMSLVEALKPWLKNELEQRGQAGVARVNPSGCLGRCREGVVGVAYPQGEWLTEVKTTDLEKIKDWILQRLNR